MYEYKPKQVNVSWGETFETATKAPLTANRRFLTLGDAQNYVDDVNKSATPGLVIVVLSNHTKDVTPSYTSGHEVCVMDVYTNFSWETAVGKSEGDTYTPGPEGTDNTGAYYIKSVGDGENDGELVKISGSGGGSTYSAGDCILISNENVISLGDVDCGEY